MKSFVKIPFGRDGLVLVVLLLALGISVLLLARSSSARRAVYSSCPWADAGVAQKTAAMDFQELEADRVALAEPGHAGDGGTGLFASELRVVAIGSAYPIPYDAVVCPFSGTPQPAMNQLDRDGDGMTDDWEIKYGLDKYAFTDASTDLDGDGFSNLEEFLSATDPTSPDSHPANATKLRFVGMKEVPFPLVFQGVSELPDGRMVFQINTAADGKTYFLDAGDKVDDIAIERFIPREDTEPDRLVVMKNGLEIVLPRGVTVPDPESQAELINILDRSSEMVTMGALLSVRNDEYTVVGVCADKVMVRSHKTGEVVEIVGFADGERAKVFDGFKE
ncbi:MAG: hypothetical protein K9M54_11605 [Kiritimatiellales bacterium]|nr:hypothetical protein [Kiritimatiellales bacterium]MCF7863731.1 hypothetical protein [Kiritimatiellales bacterium]